MAASHRTLSSGAAASVLTGFLLAAGTPAGADPEAPLPGAQAFQPAEATSTRSQTPPASLALAGGPAEPEKKALAPPAKLGWKFLGSWRDRQEFWDWFGDQGENAYTFNGSVLRLGGSYTGTRDDGLLEVQQPTLLNLPRNAVLPPPLGQLGQGGSYYDANRGQVASIFVKQAFYRRKGLLDGRTAVRAGRFEFMDGLEVVPQDPALAWLKRERISQRLLGPFNFTHVGRSFDGIQVTHDTPGLNLTALGVLPTAGVFDLDGMPTLTDVRVGYLSATHPMKGRRFVGDSRLFGLYYNDSRPRVDKVDNRPAPVRTADRLPINLGTVGGHLVGIRDVRGGRVDGVLWAAGQFGEWGQLAQRSFALTGEAGYEPAGVPGQPWFRAGYFLASGDGNPADNVHGTFFPVLPTPRLYARFPFYTLANLSDAYTQVILRPHPKLSLRSDLHLLSLAQRQDLWYVGGGAFQERPNFGYAGRPSGGNLGLATLLDFSVDYRWHPATTFVTYLAYAGGGRVIRNLFTDGRGMYAYVEGIRSW